MGVLIDVLDGKGFYDHKLYLYCELIEKMVVFKTLEKATASFVKDSTKTQRISSDDRDSSEQKFVVAAETIRKALIDHKNKLNSDLESSDYDSIRQDLVDALNTMDFS